jgi:hypothetical protein
MTWTDLICLKSEYQNDSTRITTTATIKKWSDVIYINGSHFVPRNCDIRVMLTSNSSGNKTGKKYWRASKVKVTANRTFILETLKANLHWLAEKEVKKFENIRGQNECESEEMYIALWLEYIETTNFEKKVLGPMKELAHHLELISLNVYHLTFRDQLIQNGLTSCQSLIISLLLEDTLLHNNKTLPRDLARLWIERPYSPYLKGLPDKVRRDLCLSSSTVQDPNEHIRFAAHKILENVERTGNTFMKLTHLENELRKKGIVMDISILEKDDKYEKLIYNKLNFLRNPTLSISNDMIQHLDVRSAEEGLLSLWDSMCNTTKESHNIYEDYDVSSLNTEQRIAFSRVYQNRISCVTGGPGRGKTWLSQRLCDSWRQLHEGPVLVCSSYHQPLKNLQKGMKGTPMLQPFAFRTICSCVTSKFRPLFCNCYKHDVYSTKKKANHGPALLIIEEAGVCTMVDLYNIIRRALDVDCYDIGKVSIAMIGDDKQLKPIGAGQPFADFIKLYPLQVTRLVKNMRSSSPNICHNIEAISNGDIVMKEGPDFLWHRDVPMISSPNESFFKKYLSKFNLDNDVMIVHKNDTREILNLMLHNKHLDVLCSRSMVSKHVVSRLILTTSYSCERFVKGTRVICKKTGVFEETFVTNGTCGTIVESSVHQSNANKIMTNHTIKVECDDGNYILSDYRLWELAYCLTAHKAQGSEYDCPYVYSVNDFFVARDWLYTAVSRAKQKVVYMVPNVQHKAAILDHPVRQSLSLLAFRKSEKMVKALSTCNDDKDDDVYDIESESKKRRF